MNSHSLPEIRSVDGDVATKPSTRRLFVKRTVASMFLGASLGGLTGPRAHGQTARSYSFGDLPNLDGELVVDEASRQAVADDFGRQVHRAPVAVLRPGSVTDVVRLVAYAKKRGLKIAMRGRGHSLYGQPRLRTGLSSTRQP